MGEHGEHVVEMGLHRLRFRWRGGGVQIRCEELDGKPVDVAMVTPLEALLLAAAMQTAAAEALGAKRISVVTKRGGRDKPPSTDLDMVAAAAQIIRGEARLRIRQGATLDAAVRSAASNVLALPGFSGLDLDVPAILDELAAEERDRR